MVLQSANYYTGTQPQSFAPSTTTKKTTTTKTTTPVSSNVFTPTTLTPTSPAPTTTRRSGGGGGSRTTTYTSSKLATTLPITTMVQETSGVGPDALHYAKVSSDIQKNLNQPTTQEQSQLASQAIKQFESKRLPAGQMTIAPGQKEQISSFQAPKISEYNPIKNTATIISGIGKAGGAFFSQPAIESAYQATKQQIDTAISRTEPREKTTFLPGLFNPNVKIKTTLLKTTSGLGTFGHDFTRDYFKGLETKPYQTMISTGVGLGYVGVLRPGAMWVGGEAMLKIAPKINYPTYKAIQWAGRGVEPAIGLGYVFAPKVNLPLIGSFEGVYGRVKSGQETLGGIAATEITPALAGGAMAQRMGGPSGFLRGNAYLTELKTDTLFIGKKNILDLSKDMSGFLRKGQFGYKPKGEQASYDVQKLFPKLTATEAKNLQTALKGESVGGSSAIEASLPKGTTLLEKGTITRTSTGIKGEKRIIGDIDIYTSSKIDIPKITGGKVASDVHPYMESTTHPFSKPFVETKEGIKIPSDWEMVGRKMEGSLKIDPETKSTLYRINKDLPDFLVKGESMLSGYKPSKQTAMAKHLKAIREFNPEDTTPIFKPHKKYLFFGERVNYISKIKVPKIFKESSSPLFSKKSVSLKASTITSTSMYPKKTPEKYISKPKEYSKYISKTRYGSPKYKSGTGYKPPKYVPPKSSTPYTPPPKYIPPSYIPPPSKPTYYSPPPKYISPPYSPPPSTSIYTKPPTKIVGPPPFKMEGGIGGGVGRGFKLGAKPFGKTKYKPSLMGITLYQSGIKLKGTKGYGSSVGIRLVR